MTITTAVKKIAAKYEGLMAAGATPDHAWKGALRSTLGTPPCRNSALSANFGMNRIRAYACRLTGGAVVGGSLVWRDQRRGLAAEAALEGLSAGLGLAEFFLANPSPSEARFYEAARRLGGALASALGETIFILRPIGSQWQLSFTDVDGKLQEVAVVACDPWKALAELRRGGFEYLPKRTYWQRSGPFEAGALRYSALFSVRCNGRPCRAVDAT